MRLKKIQVSGFKSFVDSTAIRFPADIVGIVGPNGCGKSNVIDAVKWVMGEMSAKNLRGANMADVIFNGSSARKPVGKASVELVFDNSEGKLDGIYKEFTEISVKRQLSREGQSDYFLNNAPCRRRDVTDVFLGTGLGARSYSIIEQGMVSRIVEAKPEELRNFVEEAAGISRYKERRRDTENRIRHTRENLQRVEDLRSELDTQLRRLQRQSQAARRYQELKTEDTEIRGQYHALRWQDVSDRIESHDEDVSEQERRLEAKLGEQRTEEGEIDALQSRRNEIQEQLNDAQAAYYSAGADIASTEQSIEHARQQLQERTLEAERLAVNLASMADEISADEGAVAARRSELETLTKLLNESRQRVEAAEHAMRHSESTQRNWQAIWEQFGVDATEPMRERDVSAARIREIERGIENYTKRQERLVTERDRIDTDLKALPLPDLRVRITDSNARVTEQERRVSELDARIVSVREQRASTGEELEVLREKRNELVTRLGSLKELQASALGLEDDETREWLEHRGLSSAARLATSLDVEPGWERAVDAVLARRVNAVVVESLDQVTATQLPTSHSDGGVRAGSVDAGNDQQRGIDSHATVNDESPSMMPGVYTTNKTLKPLPEHASLAFVQSDALPLSVKASVGEAQPGSTNAGLATGLSSPSLPGARTVFGPGTQSSLPVASDRPRLSDHVRGRGVDCSALLVGVFVADSVELALSQRRDLARSECIVTRDGVIVGVNWMHYGAGREADTGVLSRGHEIDRLQIAYDELEEKLTRIRVAFEAAAEEQVSLEESIAAERRDLTECMTDRAEIRDQLGRLETTLTGHTERRQEIVSELVEIEAQIETDVASVDESRESFRLATELSGSLEDRRAVLGEERDRLTEERDNCVAALSVARDRHHENEINEQRLSASIESLQQGVARLHTQCDRVRERQAELAVFLEQGDAPERALREALDEKIKRRDEAQSLLTEQRNKIQEVDDQLKAAQGKRSDFESRVQKLRSEVEELRMGRQEMIIRRQTILESISETGQTPEAIIESLPEEADESTWAEKLEKIAKRIERIGPVNLVAIEEYEEQSERKTYLDSQSDDLNEALATLESAIKKIDKETRDRFRETFEKLNALFQEYFPKLFGGGSATLELNDDDLLTAGVTVMARPPGKRNASIQLLSGGEKAMTAVSLLFAFFKLNPAPFCIFDEVDAPLDDANVVRYTQMLKTLAAHTQLIYITHNKITMEAADVLVGVTMGEPGVSRLVSVDVDQAMQMAAQ